MEVANMLQKQFSGPKATVKKETKWKRGKSNGANFDDKHLADAKIVIDSAMTPSFLRNTPK